MQNIKSSQAYLIVYQKFIKLFDINLKWEK